MSEQPILDSYFLDAQMAFDTATLKNNTEIVGFKCPQLCYYNAEQEIQNSPENMIFLPFDHLRKTLSTTRNRFPRKIVFPLSISGNYKQLLQNYFFHELNLVHHEQEKQCEDLTSIKIPNQTPIPNLNRPLRIFIPATSYSMVTQYAAKGLAKALKNLGADVLYYMNDHKRELPHSHWQSQEHYNFNPDIIVTINNNIYTRLNDHVVNIIWYQDPTPEIMSGVKIPWRKNDVIYTIGQGISDMVIVTGAKEAEVQTIGIDEEIFHNNAQNTTRDEKVVFVGGSYSHNIAPSASHDLFIKKVEEIWDSNRATGWKETEELADSLNIPKPLRYNLFNFVIRDRSVEWLCKCSKIPVEIYGRGWENNPIVAPFFKGFLTPGQHVAELYRKSKYVLVPFHYIESQRFAEVGACGCIPIHYDSRMQFDNRKWNDICLFYRNEQELQICLGQSIEIDSSRFDVFRYSFFAKRIIDKYNAIKKSTV